eukprot:CAMPEP_0172329914 /NCGR_PEP_ID=MMETSP1058-20130122/61129_1 /TAXON_ID=83371 /ORGANISM="Detonula confervacea, Strain CCMP 353" /LENGTH=594 /DNA_ID=CAMNT_0013047107 /DNA_START=223 /DNA_END=2007 /DNA_ORIENTATION=+
MEELSTANKHLRTILDNHERNIAEEISNLDTKENTITERRNNLNKKKLETAQANGDVDATGDDLIEVNAGGKTIAAKRSALTQLKGSRLEALFSGRWDKKLQRDSHGRIFLDVDSVSFQAIVDYLNELTISSEDDPPDPPSVDDEHKHDLRHLFELFGLSITRMLDSNVDSKVVRDDHSTILHDWLKEDGSDGEFNLLYRSSRDGPSNSTFHSKCDDKGCTMTVIKTIDGYVFGGYSNTPWGSSEHYFGASKAFLCVLTGSAASLPFKMKLTDPNCGHAVYHNSSSGPTFGGGHDLYINEGSHAQLEVGYNYNVAPSEAEGFTCGSYVIKEMEVFQVIGKPSQLRIATNQVKQAQRKMPKDMPIVKRFSDEINKAINAKWETLLNAESEMIDLEGSFKDEHAFIDTFASGDAKDVVTLNVSGTMIVTKRSTLCTAEDSVLAQQFDDSKWTEQGCNSPRVKEWSPDDVSAWAQNIHGIPDDVVDILKENEITGYELLALKKDGLFMIGITRPGTVCVILDEIKKLEKASRDFVTLIEHSPYCFGKILGYLRLKQLHSQGLVEEPALPTVCDSQKKRFEKVVKYYFPGDSAKFILG